MMLLFDKTMMVFYKMMMLFCKMTLVKTHETKGQVLGNENSTSGTKILTSQDKMTLAETRERKGGNENSTSGTEFLASQNQTTLANENSTSGTQIQAKPNETDAMVAVTGFPQDLKPIPQGIPSSLGPDGLTVSA